MDKKDVLKCLENLYIKASKYDSQFARGSNVVYKIFHESTYDDNDLIKQYINQEEEER